MKITSLCVPFITAITVATGVLVDGTSRVAIAAQTHKRQLRSSEGGADAYRDLTGKDGLLSLGGRYDSIAFSYSAPGKTSMASAEFSENGGLELLDGVGDTIKMAVKSQHIVNGKIETVSHGTFLLRNPKPGESHCVLMLKPSQIRELKKLQDTTPSPADLSARLKATPDAVNSKDSTGTTKLEWAAIQGRLDLVKILIGAGAEINAKDNDQHTALYYALDHHYWDVAKWLKSQGGQSD